MNIKTNTPSAPMNESYEQKAGRLLESYSRSKDMKSFLNENGDTEENRIMFQFIGLNEMVADENKRFTFENGMYIPGINPKMTGRLSLYSIAESSNTADEFVDSVSKMICEDKLMFTPTSNDVAALREAYKAYKLNSLNS